jgi:hypothetical protein
MLLYCESFQELHASSWNFQLKARFSNSSGKAAGMVSVKSYLLAERV